MTPLRGAPVAVVVAALLGVACGQDRPDPRADRSSVTVTLEDFAVELEPASVAAGGVGFDVVNVGPSLHEFILFRTDQPADLLPTDGRGNVEEDRPDLERIAEVEPLRTNETVAVEADLAPGGYVVICNVPAHYGLGMHASLTVE